MKLVVAKNQGFCFGGKRAVEIANKSLKNDPRPIQFLGKILHNDEVMDGFKRKGGKIISDLNRVSSGTLIISAHGASLKILKKAKNKKIIIRDTTCPFVKKNRLLIQDLDKKGYQIVIIGDREHKEVGGIKSFAKKETIIIGDVKQAAALPNFEKLGVVSQTTQSLENFNKIAKILRNKAKEIKIYNTICPNILARQKELLRIIKKVNMILVIGSHLSANTKRLVEISMKHGLSTILVNNPDELDKHKFGKKIKLGVVSGASAPNYLIKKIIKKLKTI